SSTATVTQKDGKLPYLSSGELTPIILDDFFTACRHYFRTKRIDDDDKVSAILSGFEDQRVKNWLRPKAENERILKLSFDEFIGEVRTRFLPADWEMNERLAIQHARMKPDESFIDFVTTIESHAALLLDTDSEYDTTRLRHALEAGMHSSLARIYEQPRNVSVRTRNPKTEYDEWKREVDKIDIDRRFDFAAAREAAEHALRAEKRKAASNDDGERRNKKQNGASKNVSSSTSATSAPSSRRPKLPALTDAERRLLQEHDGCFKCRRFCVGHRSPDCDNDFPAVDTYRTLTAADAAAAVAAKSKKPSAPV
ncbi:hypothetical protein GGX14DRAFT_666910, partial [Mycena pura]